MSENLTYTTHGDYQYPNLTLPAQEAMPLGKYGRLHKKYLKENKTATYNRLLLSGKLDAHLTEIDRTAMERMEQLTQEMADSHGVNEQMKISDQMKWVGYMNSIRHVAEEIILSELIYN